MSTQDQPTVIEGIVVPGDQRGRLLGFPTATLPLPDGGVSDGVYAGTVIDATDGSVHLAAVSVGRRTSFYGRDGVRLLEAHLLDFSGDLYGHSIRVELRAKLRPQRRYRGAPTAPAGSACSALPPPPSPRSPRDAPTSPSTPVPRPSPAAWSCSRSSASRPSRSPRTASAPPTT